MSYAGIIFLSPYTQQFISKMTLAKIIITVESYVAPHSPLSS